uniref:Uncharacterized protein n=1 Tax=Corvus moneduloides TaxID=1196302 RepID=A0A8C3GZS5_CORMO
MSSESFLKEIQAIGEKFLLKLQKLPKADPVEIASFSVVLLFIGEFVGGGQGVSEFLSSPTGAPCSTVFVGGLVVLAVVF